MTPIKMEHGVNRSKIAPVRGVHCFQQDLSHEHTKEGGNNMDIKKRSLPTKKTNAYNNNLNNTPEPSQCPCCGLSASKELFASDWLEELYQLAAKYPGHGINDGLIASLSYDEQYGTYQYLNRAVNNGK